MPKTFGTPYITLFLITAECQEILHVGVCPAGAGSAFLERDRPKSRYYWTVNNL